MEIDGSSGEGGGQIIRTAVGLSAVTGKDVTITNIRHNRPKKGLNHQHIAAVNAVAELCGATVSGCELESTEMSFEPGEVNGGNIKVKVATAGSLGLVMQALLIAGTAAKEEVHVSMRGGGTWNKWAPPMEYTKHVLAPLLSKMGYDVSVEVKKHGFYPKGGATVDCVLKPTKLKPLRIEKPGKLLAINGVSVASGELAKSKVADRQAKAARLRLYEKTRTSANVNGSYVDADCIGSGILVWGKYTYSVKGASSLGDKGVRAEDVGRDAANAFLKETAAVDKWAADQLIPFMGLAGKSVISVPEISGHAKTNTWVTEQFTGKKFSLGRKLISVD